MNDHEHFPKADMFPTATGNGDVRCVVCGDRIHFVLEAHWRGWEDDGDDQLSYVPVLHEHHPASEATS